MWIDASFRVITHNVTSHFNHVMRSGGALLYRGSFNSNIGATFPELYEYFPTDKARQSETVQYPAGAIFLVLTRYNFENIIYWFTIWALEKPSTKTPVFGKCKPEARNISTCHRFDMSCINTLLSNLHSFNQTLYSFVGPDLFFKFVRGDAAMASNCSRVLTGDVTDDTRARVAKMRNKILKRKLVFIKKRESGLQYVVSESLNARSLRT